MIDVKLYDILWETKGAGPSPFDNRRTEIYFAGCDKALSGNPCENCFNPSLWNRSSSIPRNVDEIVKLLNDSNVPKYVTIVGGEPTDQMDALLDLAKQLSENDYHVMLFTWHSVEWLKKNMKGQEKLFDIVVTGPYDPKYHMYNEQNDNGINNVIGSFNQQLFLPKSNTIIKNLNIVEKLILNKDNVLEVVLNVSGASYV